MNHEELKKWFEDNLLLAKSTILNINGEQINDNLYKFSTKPIKQTIDKYNHTKNSVIKLLEDAINQDKMEDVYVFLNKINTLIDIHNDSAIDKQTVDMGTLNIDTDQYGELELDNIKLTKLQHNLSTYDIQNYLKNHKKSKTTDLFGQNIYNKMVSNRDIITNDSDIKLSNFLSGIEPNTLNMENIIAALSNMTPSTINEIYNQDIDNFSEYVSNYEIELKKMKREYYETVLNIHINKLRNLDDFHNRKSTNKNIAIKLMEDLIMFGPITMFRGYTQSVARFYSPVLSIPSIVKTTVTVPYKIANHTINIGNNKINRLDIDSYVRTDNIDNWNKFFKDRDVITNENRLNKRNPIVIEPLYEKFREDIINYKEYFFDFEPKLQSKNYTNLYNQKEDIWNKVITTKKYKHSLNNVSLDSEERIQSFKTVFENIIYLEPLALKYIEKNPQVKLKPIKDAESEFFGLLLPYKDNKLDEEALTTMYIQALGVDRVNNIKQYNKQSLSDYSKLKTYKAGQKINYIKSSIKDFQLNNNLPLDEVDMSTIQVGLYKNLSFDDPKIDRLNPVNKAIYKYLIDKYPELKDIIKTHIIGIDEKQEIHVKSDATFTLEVNNKEYTLTKDDIVILDSLAAVDDLDTLSDDNIINILNELKLSNKTDVHKLLSYVKDSNGIPFYNIKELRNSVMFDRMKNKDFRALTKPQTSEYLLEKINNNEVFSIEEINKIFNTNIENNECNKAFLKMKHHQLKTLREKQIEAEEFNRTVSPKLKPVLEKIDNLQIKYPLPIGVNTIDNSLLNSILANSTLNQEEIEKLKPLLMTRLYSRIQTLQDINNNKNISIQSLDNIINRDYKNINNIKYNINLNEKVDDTELIKDVLKQYIPVDKISHAEFKIKKTDVGEYVYKLNLVDDNINKELSKKIKIDLSKVKTTLDRMKLDINMSDFSKLDNISKKELLHAIIKSNLTQSNIKDINKIITNSKLSDNITKPKLNIDKLIEDRIKHQSILSLFDIDNKYIKDYILLQLTGKTLNAANINKELDKILELSKDSLLDKNKVKELLNNKTIDQLSVPELKKLVDHVKTQYKDLLKELNLENVLNDKEFEKIDTIEKIQEKFVKEKEKDVKITNAREILEKTESFAKSSILEVNKEKEQERMENEKIVKTEQEKEKSEYEKYIQSVAEKVKTETKEKEHLDKQQQLDTLKTKTEDIEKQIKNEEANKIKIKEVEEIHKKEQENKELLEDIIEEVEEKLAIKPTDEELLHQIEETRKEMREIIEDRTINMVNTKTIDINTNQVISDITTTLGESR